MFNIEQDAKKCYKELSKKYNLGTISQIKLIELALQYGENKAIENAAKCYELQQKREEEEKKKEEVREDYKEETDDNGRTWYKRTHLYHQREESRKLKPGDIIRYKANMPGYEGVETGIMIVDSFDYKSDFAVRGYFGIYTCTPENGKAYKSYNVGYAPSINSFSFATEEEIKDFFNEIKKEHPFEHNMYFVEEGIWNPSYIKEKYSKYCNEEGITDIEKYSEGL